MMNQNLTMRANDMNKTLKTALIISSTVAVLIIVICILIVGIFNGAFNFLRPKEIAAYKSPNGEYSIVFEQMGDPKWPFGPTDVRLTLKNRDGKIIERRSAQLSDDGANAGEHNIAAVFWNDDAVTVVLRASEMEDIKVSIAYNKN